jgi:1-acyl-sn-glycerol-3-phosphate acyltransferase
VTTPCTDPRTHPRPRSPCDALDRRDPAFIRGVLPYVEWFNAHYLRVRSEGAENAPAGPAIFVANHNGGILGPDLLCTLAFLWRVLTPESPLYALAHDFVMRQLSFVGRILQKGGALAASRANAERVLRSGGQVLVYPGGDLDAYRHFGRRNEIVLLPRTGFVKVARATGAPIVPIVAEGAHRSAYIFHEGESIARALGMPRWARLERFPLAVALPWIFAPGPWLPYMPLPFRVRLRMLPPIHVAPGDDVLETARQVETRMQCALRDMCAASDRKMPS